MGRSKAQGICYGHLEKLLVSDKSHAKHGKTHLFAKGLFSGLVGLGEKFEFPEVPISYTLQCPLRWENYLQKSFEIPLSLIS